MSRRSFLLWMSPLLIASAFVGSILARNEQYREAGDRLYWEEDLFRHVRQVVGNQYVEGLSEEKSRRLFYRSVRAYMKELDRYCDFYSPEDLKELQADTKGEFGGIGVLIRTSTEDGTLLITGAREGYPAWDSGIRPGDRIVAIGDRPTSSLAQNDLVTLLKGAAGSPVEVTIKRGEEAPMVKTLKRAIIRVESVLGARIVDPTHGIGYVRVNSFLQNTVSDFNAALERLKKKGAKSIVLDLRQNDGGVLRTAVEMVDRFLARGDIVVTRGRAKADVRVERAREEGTIFPNASLVVLVNGRSASASEVVAGALQDHRRAMLVGERTYGKFLVQSIIELAVNDKERAALRLTTAKYLTPFGRFLQRDDERGIRGGLLPEVNVPITDEELTALRGRWRLEASPGWHLIEEDVKATEKAGPPDRQLDAALDLLRGVSVVEKITGGGR